MAGSTVASTAPEPVTPARWYDKWRWYELSTSKEEKALLFKLDFMILTFGCLTFFTKASFSVGNMQLSALLTDPVYSSSTFKPFKMHTSVE